jgi:hypothetical protein
MTPIAVPKGITARRDFSAASRGAETERPDRVDVMVKWAATGSEAPTTNASTAADRCPAPLSSPKARYPDHKVDTNAVAGTTTLSVVES